ncbi:hypothetical protein K402DRAFT_392766 [Aulographum hederae CBS 113979]|uniref:Phosphatidylglycerol/phosphatidylinositol transfer protein n=1 Tax=Aulographum hederae CBS 113979 TaxID=1176131 RepID=A0A6G1H2Q3_9PEZI|nr:hypothetical protein K402DRAFT_392766 [Aulographum hederae CBS 113979]
MQLTLPLLSLYAAALALADPSIFGAQQQVHLSDDLKVPGDNPLYYCSDPRDDIIQIKSVDLDPNPPKPGAPLSITASGNITKEIEAGAKVHLQVKYGVITLINREADLCDQVGNVDLACPLKKDEMKLTKDVSLPNEIPPGRYTVLADVFTKDKEKITCLHATVDMHR